MTVDSPAAIEEGDPSVEIEGQVAPVAGTSLKTAVIKLAGQSYECTKSGATNFKATVPTAALSVGDHAFTAEATLQGDLESPVGTATGNIKVNAIVVAAPGITPLSAVTVKEGDPAKIQFGIDLVAGTTLDKATVKFKRSRLPGRASRSEV